MEIIKMSIDEVTPYEKNAKLHPREQIEQIKKSILEFGNNDPIAIDKNNVIIEGHGRWMALKELGFKEIEVIKLGHLTEDQRKAYTLIHNKLTMNTDFDIEILMEELQAIEDIDMSVYDFDLEAEEPELEAEEDDFEIEVPIEPTSKRGDIWKLGNHRLMCGDSTSAEDVKELMGGAEADMVVTDPPYNVDYVGKTKDALKIKNDAMTPAEFFNFLNKCFGNMKAALKAGGAFYVWYASREQVNFEKALNENDLEVRQQLIWNKNTMVLGRQDYQWKHEPCMYGWKDGAAHYFIDDRTQYTVFEDKKPDLNSMKKEDMKRLLEAIYADKISTTIINEDKPAASKLHPTMKPIKLIARQIKNSSRLNEKVLDLFGGSGSTLIACEQLNRSCYMMEFDPKYADVIIERWETLTGQKAVLIQEGKRS